MSKMGKAKNQPTTLDFFAFKYNLYSLLRLQISISEK